MNYFIDNDVIIKLAQYELLSELQECFLGPDDVFYVLETLYYVAGFNNPEIASRVFDDDASAYRAEHFYDSCSKAQISSADIANLIFDVENPGLDEGELVLIGCAIESQPSFIVTGDKRAVCSTDKVVSESTKYTLMKSCRFIILEFAMKSLVEKFGIDAVAEKVRNKPNVDKAVSLCFRGDGRLAQEKTLYALESYINHKSDSCSEVTVLR